MIYSHFTAPGTLVIIRNSARDAIKGQKMGKRWHGLYKVVEHKGKGVYKVQSVKTGKILKKAFNACRLKAWNIRSLGKSEKQCKTLTKASPSLLEGSIYQYASPESKSRNSQHIPPSFHSFSLSPPQQSPTTPKCSTPVRQQCKSPVGGQDAQNPIDVSSQCEPSCTNYWVKEFCLTEQDRVDLFGEEWLNDKHINAANKLLQSQYPTTNGLQDPLILYRYTSGKQHFVQVLNISQSHWVCLSS